MINVGNHTFSLVDARKTLELLDHLWDGYISAFLEAAPSGTAVDPAIEARRSEVMALVQDLDLETASEAELTKPLTEAWTAFLDLGPALRADVEGRSLEGTVEFLASSKGGVPKKGVDAIEVDYRGVIGDIQQNRMLHGRPFQALCLWSSEVIDELKAAGHSIAPGNAGENVTISGIDWAQVRPGSRFAMGTVLCEVSTFTAPCSKNAEWFSEGNFNVMHIDHGPVSRVYATVIEPGRVAVGDRVSFEF